jgi:release factor glutamine methyltransferase
MTLKQAYSYSVQFLEGNGVDEADFKALCVSCHVAGIKNSEYTAHINDDIIMTRLAKLLWRLKTGEPLQYVLGKWDFYESEFYVGEGVLIPRPETEELVDLELKHAKTMTNPVIVDLCSGSGCIGLTLKAERPDSSVTLSDLSSDALDVTMEDAASLSLDVMVRQSDLLDDLSTLSFDMIVSNPPYIPSADCTRLQPEVLKEPLLALDGGADGCDLYRRIVRSASSVLSPGGKLLMEIGIHESAVISSLLSGSGHNP